MPDWTVFLTGWNIFLMSISAGCAEARVWTDYAHALLRMGNVTVPKYLYSINIPADGSLCSVSSVIYTLRQHYYWCSFMCDVAVAVAGIGQCRPSDAPKLYSRLAMFCQCQCSIYFRLQMHLWTHTHNAWTPHCQLNVSAVALIILMALVAMWGLKESSLVNTVTMLIKFGVLLFFLMYGFMNFHPENLTPLLPYQAEGVFRVCISIHVTRVWH